jgi:hypothetical protein
MSQAVGLQLKYWTYPRALPWADMKDAFGVANTPREHTDAKVTFDISTASVFPCEGHSA